MTLEQAESITDHVTNAFATKGNSFCRRSHLQDHSFTEISRAFALIIAKNRQIAGDSLEMKAGCNKYADHAGALIAYFQTAVVPDEDVEKLAKYPLDSPYRKDLVLQTMLRQIEHKTSETEELLKEETSNSFNEFCWTLNSQDPLYWQKIYTHICLKYDEDGPIGEPKPVFDGEGKSLFSYEFETSRKLRQQRQIMQIFWLLVSAGAAWAIWKFVSPLFK